MLWHSVQAGHAVDPPESDYYYSLMFGNRTCLCMELGQIDVYKQEKLVYGNLCMVIISVWRLSEQIRSWK